MSWQCGKCLSLHLYVPSYNDVRENRVVKVRAEAFEGSGVPPAAKGLFKFLSMGKDVDDVDVPVSAPGNVLLSEQEIEEDFPENRADSDFFTFYWFAVVYPIAALLTIAHLILHGVPILGFIISLAVSLAHLSFYPHSDAQTSFGTYT